jgi:hypothetical protein
MTLSYQLFFEQLSILIAFSAQCLMITLGYKLTILDDQYLVCNSDKS